jgi:4-hydroxythreonine-4-phosphate dehydrogenase
MSDSPAPILALTTGDINGIGPEVIIKTLEDTRLVKYATPVVYGSSKLFSYYRGLLNLPFNFQLADHADAIKPGRINLINVWDDRVEVKPGEANEDGGKYAWLSLQAAVADVKAGKVDAIVTAPINKELMQNQGFNFPGHTEYLTQESGVTDSLMLLVSSDLRVGVVTGHVPLSEVAGKLSSKLIHQKLTLLANSLKTDFGIRKPKIAVLGLNPHAGENGRLGKEDQDIILPVINDWKERGELVFGPYPADGFFGARQHQQVDAILAMYHDQGLIPFKTIAFDSGVNFTAGLTFVRTSPDHGTAYAIAGKNEASPESFRQAMYVAMDVVKNRRG